MNQAAWNVRGHRGEAQARTRSPQAEQRSRSNTVRLLKGEAFWSTAADFGVRAPVRRRCFDRSGRDATPCLLITLVGGAAAGGWLPC